MAWTFLSEKLPQSSGSYLISITRPYLDSTLTFKYVAYFDVNTKNWHQYDPFSDKEEIGEKIFFSINGWFDNLSVLLK